MPPATFVGEGAELPGSPAIGVARFQKGRLPSYTYRPDLFRKAIGNVAIGNRGASGNTRSSALQKPKRFVRIKGPVRTQ
jgi:hypothetical protein